MTTAVSILDLSVETTNPKEGAYLALVQDGVTTKISHFNFLKKVLVTSVDNLPAASGGYHLLENKCYSFFGNVALINGLQFQASSCVNSVAVNQASITYTGTNAFLKAASGASIEVENITILHSSAALVDFNSAAGSLALKRVNAIGASGGTITEMFGHAFNECFFQFSVSGFSYAGTSAYGIILYKDNILQFTAGTGTMVALGSATTATLSMQHNKFVIGTGRTGVSGLSASGNITDYAIVIGNDFDGGGGTYLSGIAPSDLKWTFSANRNIKDSDTFGGGSFVNNATTTVITAGTPIAIAGTFVQSPDASRITCSSAGLITGLNLEPVNKTFNVSLDVNKAGGSTPVLTFWLYKNGTAVSNIQTQRTVSAATGSVSMTVPVEIDTGDTFQIYVDSDINVTITVVNCSIATS